MLDRDDALRAAAAELGATDVRPFAVGGQKVVARARHGSLPVVLKVVLLSDSGADPNALERCEREVALLKSLDAQNIVKLVSDMVAVGDGPDAAAWLEEELDGDDLAVLLGAPWPWPDVEEMLLGLGAGLAAMHSNDYVHRDLSAKNVRRTSTGLWKVMDPGFAKHLKRSSITGLYQPGTPGYMSPEHAAVGGRITPASDIFCLGVLAYQALTAVLPVLVGPDLLEYAGRLRTGQAPPVGIARPDLTSERAALVDTCLARQPARRFLDADELLARLSPSAGGPT